ncbi:MAG: hypothetical protein RSE13_10185 [Planktothrix sp. GU0601_MAG3]|nr:MAG: hypothetical protein RSE13_10185 [Planktothrix sp. GU0601_MAG3]
MAAIPITVNSPIIDLEAVSEPAIAPNPMPTIPHTVPVIMPPTSFPRTQPAIAPANTNEINQG